MVEAGRPFGDLGGGWTAHRFMAMADEHCAAPTFAAWEAFAGSDPFTAEPSVQFYVPTTSVAADHAPCTCVAAFLAALDFVPRGC